MKVFQQYFHRVTTVKTTKHSGDEMNENEQLKWHSSAEFL